MIEDPQHRRFAGQARLVRMLLWKIGECADMEACLDAANAKGMLDAEDMAFARMCLAAEEGQRESGELEIYVDEAVLRRLQRLADRLNRADSA